MPEILQPAKAAFDSAEYEQAVRLLTAAMPTLDTVDNPNQWRSWAFERRAWAKANLRDREGAFADFTEVLRLNPSYSAPPDMSPATRDLVEEVRQRVIGSLVVSPELPDARIQVDNQEVRAGLVFPLAAGAHEVAITRQGYEPHHEQVAIAAGTLQELKPVLKRVAAVLRIRTKPADSEVWLGAPGTTTLRNRGNTSPGGQLVLDDLQPGEYRLEVRHDCYSPKLVAVKVAELTDYDVPELELLPAVGILRVSSRVPNAQLLVDGEPRGSLPARLAGVCAGVHLVEVRSAVGSYSKETSVSAGATVDIEADIRPTVALLSSAGTAGSDLTRAAARVLSRDAGRVQFVVPASNGVTAEQVTALIQPAPGLPEAVARRRSELSAAMADALHVQAVAVVSLIDAAPDRLQVQIFAKGSSQPDSLTIAATADATPAAVVQIDRPLPLFRCSAGILAVDMAGTSEPVVAAIGQSVPGLNVGDRIKSVAGKSSLVARQINEGLCELAGDASSVSLEVQEAGAADKTLTIQVVREPRLAFINDQSLSINTQLMVVDWLAAMAGDPATRDVAHLNLAVLLMRINQWERAAQLLTGIDLPAGKGVSRGTVAYLRGLCYEHAGDAAKASDMWRAASEAGGLLSEDGPEVMSLVQRKLKR
jgi:hypothetical protein